MITHKSNRKILLYKLKLKWELLEMSKRLLVAATLCGVLFAVAPMVGIAEPTSESVKTGEQVEQADGAWNKAKAIWFGGVREVKGVVSSLTQIDKRLAKKDAQLKKAMKYISELEEAADEKLFVHGLSLQRTKECVVTIGEFLRDQVEVRNE